MGEHVWVSNARADSRLILIVKTDIAETAPDRSIDAERRNHAGKPVPADMCPRRIWNESDEPPITSLPDVFYANSYWIVSAELAAIIGRADLGEGALYPVSEGVFQADRESRVPGDFFTWTFGNEKRAFLERQSPKAEPFIGMTTRDWCTLPAIMEDDAMVVSKAALAGPDIWVDPLLFKSIFLSGPLGDTLGPKFRKALRLFRCPVA